ncbi:MAG: hypothetical protein AB7S26_13220 [Sandaracinaceae bacterium]
MRFTPACFAFAHALVLLASLPGLAHADDVPFIVIEGPAGLDARITTGQQLATAVDAVITAYRDSGSEMPDVLSVWTTFPMSGSSIPTFFYPIANDITGTGLDSLYDRSGVPGGVFGSSDPPLRAILLHNDITTMDARAAQHEAPTMGYARYLFLLELSHVWGPQIAIPGAAPQAMLAFDFHWSFYTDLGGSPAGGNLWIDNGDGTFTTGAQDPQSVRYSMLDLYLMGLATAEEVPPFGLLEDAVVPSDARDPLSGRVVGSMTFPWFSDEPLTVEATRRELTIDDVIATNGARSPAAGASPTMFTLGIALVVPAGASEAERAAWIERMTPIAASLAPAFEDATHGRGHLEVVTSTTLDPPAPDAGTPTSDAGVPSDAGSPAPTAGCACTAVRSRRAPGELALVGVLGLALALRRSKR